MARTLVVHPGALGDVLLAIPALRAVRGVFATAGAGTRRRRSVSARDGEVAVSREVPAPATEAHRVVLAAQSHIGELLQALGEVDAYVRFEALGLDGLFATEAPTSVSAVLRDVERVVCWYGARDPDFVRRLRGIVPDAAVAPSVPAAGTVWEHLVATATESALDVPLVEPVHVPPGLVEDGRRALRRAGWDGAAPLVVVHPGASGPRKRWPVERFVTVLETLPDRFALVVHEGPTDAEAVRALITRLHRQVIHLVNPPLPALAGALVQAAAYLGNDSGVSHLAAAVGVRSVVLFRPDLTRWVPWATSAERIVVHAGDAADAAAAAALLARALAVPACNRD